VEAAVAPAGDSWPSRIDTSLDSYLCSVGRIVRRFGERADSRARIYGVEAFGARYVVKTADDDEAVQWLWSAVRFHTAVQHPTIAGVLAHVTTPTGLALVEPWAPGEPLLDAFDPSRTPIHQPDSAFSRFRRLPVPVITAALDDLLDAHVAVTRAGFVAVDLYDGCLMYDVEHHRLSLIDLDHYRPGPYVLEAERQIGSRSYMAPEELQRGACIDERATVFTLGRFLQILLGCARSGPAERHAFRGSDEQFDISVRATRPSPEQRWATVSDLAHAWRS
jgi:serine/threonine-protein kinase